MRRNSSDVLMLFTRVHILRSQHCRQDCWLQLTQPRRCQGRAALHYPPAPPVPGQCRAAVHGAQGRRRGLRITYSPLLTCAPGNTHYLLSCALATSHSIWRAVTLRALTSPSASLLILTLHCSSLQSPFVLISLHASPSRLSPSLITPLLHLSSQTAILTPHAAASFTSGAYRDGLCGFTVA